MLNSKRQTTKSKEPTIVVANDPKDRKGALKKVGGSQSDNWNHILANQAAHALWVNPDATERDRQLSATVAALVGIEPRDELEGMIAAQLIAAHNAAMECYRRVTGQSRPLFTVSGRWFSLPGFPVNRELGK